MSKELANTSTKVEIKFPNRFHVVLLNDDYTPMDFVIQLLIEIFNRNIEEATNITMDIHTNGKGTAGTYSHEVAEQKQHEAQMISRHHGHPLKIVLEKM
jgi:ATP-dependent Clp protease adaptor protein ClpS